jgi:hypothetical protein
MSMSRLTTGCSGPERDKVPASSTQQPADFAEVHWYEATGIGRKEFKIKRFLD